MIFDFCVFSLSFHFSQYDMTHHITVSDVMMSAMKSQIIGVSIQTFFVQA